MYNRPLTLLHVDFHGAFGTVDLIAIAETMGEYGVDYRYCKLIYNVHKNTTAERSMLSRNSIARHRQKLNDLRFVDDSPNNLQPRKEQILKLL